MKRGATRIARKTTNAGGRPGRKVFHDGLTWAPCPICNADHPTHRFEKHGLAVVECDGCGLLYVNPRPTASWLAAWYRDCYFDEREAGASGVQHLQQDAIKLATARLQLARMQEHARKGRLLDVGCAGGYLVQAATDAGWSAFGLEPSLTAGRQAAKVHRDRGWRPIRMVTGRLEEAPCRAGVFDVVTMIDVLEHVVDPRACLVQARRLLAPRGVLMIETPNMGAWLPRVLGSGHPWVRPPEHLTYFTPATMERLLAAAGFRLKQLHESGRKVLTLDYLFALTESTHPGMTSLARLAIGWWHALCRRPFTIPLDVLVAIAEPV